MHLIECVRIQLTLLLPPSFLPSSLPSSAPAYNETSLAWLRTSLGLVSLGIAITQLFKIPDLVVPRPSSYPLSSRTTSSSGGGIIPRSASASAADLSKLQNLGKPIGGAFIALGMLVLLLGTLRFFAVQAQMVRRNRFSPSRIETSATALCTGALMVAAFGVILGVRYGQTS